MHALFILTLIFPLTAAAGVELSGRLLVPGTDPPHMLAAVRAFGFSSGAGRGQGFRTWEMEPRGWWKLEGAPGDWTVLFTGPSHFVRPCLLTTRVADGAKPSSLRPLPRFDYACFTESAWDPKAARTYWQPLTAKSTSVTHVGFKLATDGVDGPGPGAATMVLRGGMAWIAADTETVRGGFIAPPAVCAGPARESAPESEVAAGGRGRFGAS